MLVVIIASAIASLFFVSSMSFVAEPKRQQLNAIIVGGAAGAYLSGGFGAWELILPVVGSMVAYEGLRNYRMIAIGWWLHAAWDLAHHFFGNSIWPFMPLSSMGCVVFDSLIAIWFWLGAPSLRR